MHVDVSTVIAQMAAQLEQLGTLADQGHRLRDDQEVRFPTRS
jgi:hypothetical protein